VLGRASHPALLALVAALPEDEVLSALESAHRLRLLEAADGAYRFAHDLVREVVEADVGPARRLVLHRRAAEVLEAGPGEPPLALLAFHYARSDAQDKAVRYLERAGDQAEAQFAHTSAAAYYQELIERLESSGRPLDALRIREKLGTVLAIEAHYDAALVALEPAADSYQAAGDLESLGRVTAKIGQIHSNQGTQQEGLARVLPLVERLEADGASYSIALLCLTLTDLLQFSGRISEALGAAERATGLARALGDMHMVAMAEMRRGSVLEALGRVGDARGVFREAVPVAEAVGDFQCLSRIFNNLAHLCLHEAAFESSLHYVNRAQVQAERIGDARNLTFQLMHRGLIYFCSGNWRLARADAEQAAALCQQIGLFFVSGYPHMVLGFICFGEGNWAEAAAHLEQAVGLADSRAPEALVMASSVLAEIDLLEGRPEEARARVDLLLQRFPPENCDNAYLLPKLAWAHLELGDLTKAEVAAAQAVAFTQSVEDFLNLVEAVRVQALVFVAQQRWKEAERILTENLAETQRRCYSWGEARVLDSLGQLHTRTGAIEPARDRLEAALAIFQRLGARKDSARLQAALARLPQAQ
jgi:tetratricopeptide (TPR) repeat protein